MATDAPLGRVDSGAHKRAVLGVMRAASPDHDASRFLCVNVNTTPQTCEGTVVAGSVGTLEAPAAETCRVPRNDRMVWDIACHHGPGADNRGVADANAL